MKPTSRSPRRATGKRTPTGLSTSCAPTREGSRRTGVARSPHCEVRSRMEGPGSVTKLEQFAMDPRSTPGGIARCISRMSSRISPSMGVVQATASGFSSASTGGSRVGASGPQFPGVLDAIPAKAAKARTRASARRSESGAAFRRTRA